MTTFLRGDIVTLAYDAVENLGNEYTVLFDQKDEDALIYLMGGKYEYPRDCTIVYRPPTREEVLTLRDRVAELEAALRPFAEAGGKFDVLYEHLDAARKAMGLEE